MHLLDPFWLGSQKGETSQLLKQYNIFIKSWEFWILCFDRIHSSSSPNSSQIHPFHPKPLHIMSSLQKTTSPVQSVLPIHSWVWSHPLKCGQFTSGHTLKENWFLPTRSHQLPTVPQLRVGTHEPLLLHAGIVSGFIFCGCCACNHNLYFLPLLQEKVNITVEKTQFFLQRRWEIISSKLKHEWCWPGNTDLGYHKFHVLTWKQFNDVIIVTEKKVIN